MKISGPVNELFSQVMINVNILIVMLVVFFYLCLSEGDFTVVFL